MSPHPTTGSPGTLGIPATTPAGTYDVTVHAADSTTGTALQGDIMLPVAVALNITASTTPQPTGTSTGVLATMVTANSGKTGTLSYTLDAASTAAGLVIDPVTGAISVGSALPQTRSGVVRATDSGTATGAVASSHAVADIPFTVTVTALGALTITNPATVGGVAGNRIDVPLTATGGTVGAGYTWAIVGNANTCTITGSTLTIPASLSSSQSFTLTVTVTDANGLNSVVVFTVTLT